MTQARTNPVGEKSLDTETKAPIAEPKPQLNMGDAGVYFANLDELYRFCQLVAKTDFVPKDFQNNPEKCLCAVQYGMEVGMKPMMSLRSVMVVNGHPSLWGDGLLSVCQSSPMFDWSRWREYAEGKAFDDDYTCICVCARRGQSSPTVRSFSVADAKRAGLWAHEKKLYGKYPARMLQMRARAFSLRDTFARELGGLQSAEEMHHVALVESALDGIDMAGDPDEMRTQMTKSEAPEAGTLAELAATAAPDDPVEMPPPNDDIATVKRDCIDLAASLEPNTVSEILHKCGFTSTIAASKCDDFERVSSYREALAAKQF